MKIKQLHLGADHGGFAIKEELKPGLVEQLTAGGTLSDWGAHSWQSDDDYPQFGHAVAQAVTAAAASCDQDPEVWGILFCRSGAGMNMVANRYPLARAALCHCVKDAQQAREHNNANIVVLEGDRIGVDEARAILQTFFATPFGGGRHVRRLQQLADQSSTKLQPLITTNQAAAQ